MLSLHVAAPTIQDDAAELLLELGGSAVQVEGAGANALTSYLPPPQDPDVFAAEALAELRRRVALVHGAAAADRLRADWRWEADQDWASTWRRGLRPRRVGPFLVTPSWCQPELEPPGSAGSDMEPPPHVIVLDPEMAFGTGEHATTRGALRLLAESVPPGARVLDVGTGSGILAIAAALLGAGRVLAVEADADALGNATDNVRRNGVADRVELRHAVVDPRFLDNSLRDDGSLDLIVANVLSGVLRPLLSSFHGALGPGGRLILGGILEEEAEDMLAAARAAGFTLLVEDVEAEWWGGLFART